MGQQPPHVVDAFTWREYVHELRDELGGWTDLAREILKKARTADEEAEDEATIIRGLKRLAKRQQAPGDKYGALLLRIFKLPPRVVVWGRLMGQYHSRLADLPVWLRQEQLLRWDRPPVSESPAAAWIHVGLASVAHRQGDLEEAEHRLALAEQVRGPEDAARAEIHLFAARLASDRGDMEAEGVALDRASRVVAEGQLDADDQACYQARLLDQRANRAARGWREAHDRLRSALALYEAMPAGTAPPFAAFRRDIGRAWCLWRLGERDESLGLARMAEAHAGDGGYVRLRVMAINLQASILGPDAASEGLRVRAKRLANHLDDLDLERRVSRGRGESPS